MSYADKVLTGRNCGQAFTFTAGEQGFHASKGFQTEPSRCRDCRADRKADQGKHYDSGGRHSARYGSHNHAREEREMYSATCGKEARMPFQPDGDKPVYCSECFTLRKSSSYGRGSGHR
jgi:CxxC-x17-CxxC domain-containing protein